MKGKNHISSMIFVMLLSSFSVFSVVSIANEAMDTPSNMNFFGCDDVNIDETIDIETEVLDEDPMMRLEVEVPEYDIDVKSLWNKLDKDEPLVKRLAIGILRSRSVKGSNKNEIRWERCGEVVPDEDLNYQSLYLASHFLAALDEVEKQTGVKLNPWGAFATMMNESSADECALDFASRRWASTHEAKRLTVEEWNGNTTKRKIVRKIVDKFRLSYTRDEVWSIINDSYYDGASIKLSNGKIVKLGKKSDMGPWQRRISIKDITREEFDRTLSVIPGIYDGAYEMARRALWYSAKYKIIDPHPRPWVLWPGFDIYNEKNMLYDERITMVARWLGATRSEMTNEIAVVTGSGKNRKYVMNRWVKIKD